MRHAIKIPLSQDKFAIIDDIDFPKVSKYKWFYGQGYAKSGKILLHRFILNAPRNKDVDHINRDTLDNRRTNLRICDTYQNLGNAITPSHNSSGFKGVSQRNVKTWRAYIHKEQKYYHLGNFKSPILAAKAYNEAAKEYFGEFARLNVI